MGRNRITEKVFTGLLKTASEELAFTQINENNYDTQHRNLSDKLGTRDWGQLRFAACGVIDDKEICMTEKLVSQSMKPEKGARIISQAYMVERKL